MENNNYLDQFKRNLKEFCQYKDYLEFEEDTHHDLIAWAHIELLGLLEFLEKLSGQLMEEIKITKDNSIHNFGNGINAFAKEDNDKTTLDISGGVHSMSIHPKASNRICIEFKKRIGDA